MKENVNSNECIKKSSSVVEVDLPKSFCEDKSHELLYLLFSNQKRTGGESVIEEKSVYKPHELKAFICYPNEMIAERVSSKGVIEYDDYRFKVKLSTIECSTSSCVAMDKTERVRNNLERKNNNEPKIESLMSIDTTPCHRKNEVSVESNVIKVTDLSGYKNLTIDKINSRFLFAKNNIIGIELNQNTAIVKFDTSEGMSSIISQMDLF